MFSSRTSRPLSLVFVLALLLAPWPSIALPLGEVPHADAATDHPLDHFLSWLVAFWDDAGCGWDPDGGCRETPDNRCTADPNGAGCRDSLDAGCTWDPNGGSCLDSPDNGCTADPDGGACREDG